MIDAILTELEALVEIYTNLVVEREGLPNELVIYFDAEIKFDDFNEVIIKKNEKLSFRIRHFPPITTRFTFAASPAVVVDVDVMCNWLPRNLKQNIIDKIQSILSNDSIDNDGILWICFQFIENECLSLLFGSGGVAGASCSNLTIDINELMNDDEREEGGGGNNDNNKLFEILTDFDRQKRKSIFDKSIIECGVCFVCKRGSDCMELEKCGHVMCLKCVTDFFDARMKSGNLELQCSLCDETMEYAELKLVINHDEFDRWDTLLLNQCLKQASGISECPRCSLPMLTEGDQLGVCNKCRFVFCVECRMTYHGPEKCNRAEVAAQLLLDEINKLREKRLEDKLIRQATQKLLKEVPRCPQCKHGYEKIEGCNKMACPICRCFFCHLCHEILNKNHPYDHFWSGQCSLFRSK